MLIKMAVRNILRNLRRAFITVMTIAAGTVGVILAGGFIDDMYEGLREFTIHSNTGHLQVFQKGYIEKGGVAPFGYMISDYDKVISLIRSVEHVRAVFPRLLFQGLLSTGETTRSFLGIGVDPSGEAEMAQIPPQASKYRYLGYSIFSIEGEDLSEEDPFGAAQGKGLAASMGLKVGDEVTVLTTTREGSINGANFKVRGIFLGGLKEYDDIVMKIPIKTAQRLLGLGDSAHILVILLDDTTKTEEIRRVLASRFKAEGLQFEMKSWLDLSHFYQGVAVMFDSIFTTLSLIIYGVVVIGITNTMMMATFERTREIGTMMAIGRKRWDIIFLFLLEALLLGLIGGLIGLFLGTILAKIISAIGIPMPPPPGFTRAFIRRVNLVPSVLIIAFILSVVTALLSGLYPAVRAVRLKVVEALRHV